MTEDICPVCYLDMDLASPNEIRLLCDLLDVRLLSSCAKVVSMTVSALLAQVHVRMPSRLSSRRKLQKRGSWIMQSSEVIGSLG